MIEELSQEDFDARQRLFLIKQQLDSPHAGKYDLECPYCASFNRPGQEFCCKLFRDAVITILMGRRQALIEATEKYGAN